MPKEKKRACGAYRCTFELTPAVVGHNNSRCTSRTCKERILWRTKLIDIIQVYSKSSLLTVGQSTPLMTNGSDDSDLKRNTTN